ncbi:MAG: formyltransferase family protein [Actinomycetota bacterium]
MTARLVVLVSGSGSNLQAIIDGCASGELDAEVVGVVSNRLDAYGLVRADGAGIPIEPITPLGGEERQTYDTRLATVVERFAPDWIVLAGWMRLLSMAFLERFPERVVNLHPALPGELPGTRAIERAHVETYCVASHRRRDQPADMGAGVRYVDVFERRAGECRILDRTVVFGWARTTSGGEPIPPGYVAGTRSTTDFSYGRSLD